MITIIPTPKEIKELPGTFSVCGAGVYVSDGCDSRIVRAAGILCGEMGRAAGVIVPLSCGAPKDGSITVSHGGDEACESYTLDVTENRVDIRAPGARGAFYAIQTLRQLTATYGAKIPCCSVSDSPDFSYRGFYQDITRGRVNKPEKLRHIVDMLSLYKVNSLQLYIEDAFLFKEFEGMISAEEAMSAEEMIGLDEYCYQNFIELVPSLSTFGHLFTLLQSDRYNYLCELPEHKMTTHYWMEKQWHHTIDPYNPDSIKVIGSMIEQYMPLFRSDKFNICCDETMDLCSGRNAGRDKGEAYFHHLNALIDLVESHGKKVMMWGDVCMAHADLMQERVKSPVTVLNWCYHKTVPQWLGSFFAERGYESIVCPGTSCWNGFFEDIDTSVGNISEFAALGKKYGALGMLNTNWGDFGHVCSFNCNLYGMLFGAQKSWNVDAETGEDYEKAATMLLYGITQFNMADMLRDLAKAQRTCDWSRFVVWHSRNYLEGQNTELRYDDSGELSDADAENGIEICRKAAEKLRSLGRDGDTVICDLILAARATELMNRLMLHIRGVVGYEDGEKLQEQFDSWFEDYSAAWLRDDKPSQLWRLGEFIKHITDKKPE